MQGAQMTKKSDKKMTDGHLSITAHMLCASCPIPMPCQESVYGVAHSTSDPFKDLG